MITSRAEENNAPLAVKRLNSVLAVGGVGSGSAGLAFCQVGEVPGLFGGREIQRRRSCGLSAIGEVALAGRGRVAGCRSETGCHNDSAQIVRGGGIRVLQLRFALKRNCEDEILRKF